MMDEKRGYLERFHNRLSNRQIEKAENFYDLKFPNSYKKHLKLGNISKKNLNWADYSVANVRSIKDRLSRPLRGIIWDLERNSFEYLKELSVWKIGGYETPRSKLHMIQMVLEKHNDAPKPIPIFSYRYIFEGNDDEISIYSMPDLIAFVTEEI